MCSQRTRMAAQSEMITALTELSEEETRDQAALARILQKKADLANIAVLQI